MFAYNKNYEENTKLSVHQKYGNGPGSSNLENTDSEIQQYRVFKIEYVVKKFNEYGEENAHQSIRAVANWKLRTTENVLQALLKNGMDKIAW